MPSIYKIVVLHDDELTELKDQIQNILENSLNQVFSSEDVLTFAEEVDEESSPECVAVLYLGNKKGKQNTDIRSALSKAIDYHYPILPIVRDEDDGRTEEKLPSLISHINAVNWDHDSSLAVATLMRMLGLLPDARKVFLSYIRRSSSDAALQLHTRLMQTQFDVFLDRFAVPPGADFQKKLSEDLWDKAFVLLLDSGDLQDSSWVEYEVSYALANRLGVLAVVMPNVTKADMHPSVPEDHRVHLRKCDVTDDNQLTEDALQMVLHHVETAHASALKRRREQMLGSLVSKLRHDDYAVEVRPVSEWAILANSQNKKPAIIQVAPRPPTAQDLHELYCCRESVAESTGTRNLSGMMLHEMTRVPGEKRVVLCWIARSTDLKLQTLLTCSLENED